MRPLVRADEIFYAAPACPAAISGTIAGTITAANVRGITGQGITPSDLDSALEAVRGDLAYANMHTSFPGR